MVWNRRRVLARAEGNSIRTRCVPQELRGFSSTRRRRDGGRGYGGRCGPRVPGRRYAGCAETGFADGGFDDVRGVAAGGDGDDDLGNLDAADIAEGGRGAGAVDEVVGRACRLKSDDDVKLLLPADGGDAVELPDVDDADDVHEVLDRLDGCGHDAASAFAPEAGRVVGDESVAALDEGEGGFAFADAGLAHEQDALPVDLDHRAVDDAVGAGKFLDDERGGVDELVREHRGRQERRLRLVGERLQLGDLVEVEPAADDDGRELLGEDGAELRGALLGRHAAEVGPLVEA